MMYWKSILSWHESYFIDSVDENLNNATKQWRKPKFVVLKNRFMVSDIHFLSECAFGGQFDCQSKSHKKPQESSLSAVVFALILGFTSLFQHCCRWVSSTNCNSVPAPLPAGNTPPARCSVCNDHMVLIHAALSLISALLFNTFAKHTILQWFTIVWFVCLFFWPSGAVSRDGLLESCTCRLRLGGPPLTFNPDPPPVAWTASLLGVRALCKGMMVMPSSKVHSVSSFFPAKEKSKAPVLPPEDYQSESWKRMTPKNMTNHRDGWVTLPSDHPSTLPSMQSPPPRWK